MKKYHDSQCIRAALGLWMRRDWHVAAKIFLKPDGKLFTPTELKVTFYNLLNLDGVEYVPLEKCDNFDPVKGCLGHEVGGGEEQSKESGDDKANQKPLPPPLPPRRGRPPKKVVENG